MLKNWILLYLIPFLGWLFIYLIGKTARLKIRGEGNLKVLKEANGQVIYAFWHNRLLLITYALRHRGIIVLVSSSRDGEYISRTVHKLGTKTVRGSTTFRGARALLQMTKKLKSGFDGAVTPDGPQGPKYKVQPGVIHLAKKTGLPILPLTYSAEKKIILKSWDGFIVPHPFSRTVLIYGTPLEVPRESNKEVLETKKQELEKSLQSITQQADEYFKVSEFPSIPESLAPKEHILIKRNWQELLIRVAEEQEKGCLFSLFRTGLTVFSGIYALLMIVRLFFYRFRLLRRTKLSAYVISVGNITVGGTGKTPTVAMLAEKLQKKKRKVAILSRGYKRISDQQSRVSGKTEVVSDGKKLLMEVREAGDEPYLLAKNLPGVAVLVGKNRLSSGNYALTNFAADTLILDDSYQYWPLERDLDIMVIDSLNPFGNGYLLPRGRLREPLKNLRRSSLFLLTRVDQADDLQGLRERLRKIKPGAKIVETIHHPDHLIDLKTGEKQEPTILSGKKILALSSLGHPQSFEKTLNDLGALLVEKVRFPDHHWYRETELRKVEEAAIRKGAELIVTTEKDAVRISKGRKSSPKLLYLVIKLRIVKGKEILEELLQGKSKGSRGPGFKWSRENLEETNPQTLESLNP